MQNEIQTVADRLKQIRLKRNYSQDFLAKKLGVTQKAYSKIENNETRLNVETLVRLAEILETPVGDFFQDAGKPIYNDFSTRHTGDNVIYKTENQVAKEELYDQLLKAKDDTIQILKAELTDLKARLAQK
jgi:transcriptional regulator with XRE-family HTH domain